MFKEYVCGFCRILTWDSVECSVSEESLSSFDRRSSSFSESVYCAVSEANADLWLILKICFGEHPQWRARTKGMNAGWMTTRTSNKKN